MEYSLVVAKGQGWKEWQEMGNGYGCKRQHEASS